MSVSVTVSGKFSRRRVPAPRDSFLLRACSTTLLHSSVDPSNRSQHDPLVCNPAAKIKQWLAFAGCPIRVAQGIRNVLWPITFRRREAQRAGRQTVEDLGKDEHHTQRAASLRASGGGTSLAQPPHCKSASVRRGASQMPKDRFACGTTMPHRPAYGHQARDATQPSLRSCRQRNRSPEMAPFPRLLS